MSAQPANVKEVHRWTRQQYDQMVTAGVFQPEERVELIDGYIVDMTPQSSIHATTVSLVEEALRLAFPHGYCIRVQMPLAIDDMSEPEPDVAVVPGNPRDYRDAHPATAVLVVEVASGSLKRDQGLKKALYARNGIQEYWVVNLDADCVEVYQGPQGDDYQIQMKLSRGENVRPVARPEHSIPVIDLLP